MTQTTNYPQQRAAWLKALQVGDKVKVKYYDHLQADVILADGEVARLTRTLFICNVQVSGQVEQIRFERRHGLQWGGGMALHMVEGGKQKTEVKK